MELIFLTAAILLDVGANVVLKYSNGFQRKGLGSLALLFVVAAFACMAQALRELDLSIAYGIWGATGLCLTTLSDCVFFGQQVTIVGWLGLACTVWGVTILHSIT